MTAIIAQNMAPIMFASLVIVLLLGFPVAFSLAFVGLGYGAIGIWLGLFHPTFLQALPDRVFAVMSNDTLLAIPFFILAAAVMNAGGITPRLVDLAMQLVGHLRGGLGQANVISQVSVQLSLAFGVALGGGVLEAARLLTHGGGEPILSDFHIAFWVIGAVTLISTVMFAVKVPKGAGLHGHAHGGDGGH